MMGPKEKKERALGVHLFLKAERCNSGKCALIRRPYRPGVHGKSRRKQLSEYGLQLAEKQKIMFSYGLREKAMERIFTEALHKKEAITTTIVNLLERRLDNAVFRMGFAPSRITAKQYISHGHILVNGRRVTIPSFQVKAGDMLAVREKSKTSPLFKDLAENLKKYETPTWLQLDREKLEGKVKSLPFDVEIPFDINLVVDFYSK